MFKYQFVIVYGSKSNQLFAINQEKELKFFDILRKRLRESITTQLLFIPNNMCTFATE